MKFITYHILFHILIMIFENNVYHVIMPFTCKRVHKMFPESQILRVLVHITAAR